MDIYLFPANHISSKVHQQGLPKVVGTPIPLKDFPILFPICVTNGSSNPLHPLYNAESIAETFNYTKMHHFYLQGYSYLLHTTLF